jgi:CheY-like chemotaxis protein
MEPHKKMLLLIAENEVRKTDIRNLLAGDDLEIVDVPDLASAVQIVGSRQVDGIVLDWVLPQAAGIEFIDAVQSRTALQVPPIIVSGSRTLTEEQVAEIHHCARSGPVRYAPSIERLLDETVLLLHRQETSLSTEQRRVLAEVRDSDPMLAGRKVLVIDDDLRNIFALASVLEQRELKVLHAENGRAGVELLKNTRDIDIVLMDIMMPEMDGYETMRAVRRLPEFKTLPIIALTAKAMKGDREKCLRAGASDYVTKPVDLDMLFSVMRVWMARDVDNRFEHGAVSLPNWLLDHEQSVDDDRNMIQPGDPVLLIVEDDAIFAGVLVERAHELGLKALVALRGATALNLARNFKPNAITLDVRLPDMSGWTVLDHLKHDPVTRHIPVHVISGTDTAGDGFALGAMTCIQKASQHSSLNEIFPVVQNSMQSRTKKLLVMAGSEAMRKEICDFVAADDLMLLQAGSLRQAMDIVSSQPLDGIVLDWAVSGGADLELIEKIQTALSPFVPPIIVFGSAQLDTQLAAGLHRRCRHGAVRYVSSLDRLLDEVALLLHRPEEHLTSDQKEILSRVRRVDPMLAGRRILVVDDDLRNIFALTSVLEQHDITVLHAENGKRGIEVLQKEPGIDLVLMDIMMPEMDGYETTRAIRQLPGFVSLPIIALTAKAMKGDREKCLQAGASDYVTKPVDLAYLFSVMRVWLAGVAAAAAIAGDPSHRADARLA